MKRSNCFDLLRLSLAGCVIYGHGFLVGGYGEDPLTRLTHGQVHLAGDAVLGFFGISGYLISASRDRNGLWAYLRKRVSRIFPAFWVCLGLTALAALVAGAPLSSAVSYVGGNATLRLHQAVIGNLLAGNPYPSAINGSLWTLLPEFICYLALAPGLRRPVVAVVTISLLLGHALAGLGATTPLLPALIILTHQTGFFAAFAVGSALHEWPEFRVGRRGTLGLALMLALLAHNGGYALWAPVIIPWLMVSVGENFVFHLADDVSYGTYLYGFVVQQLVARALPPPGFLPFFLLTLGLSAGLGWASWKLVERRFVR